MNKFKIGNVVKVINYGGLVWYRVGGELKEWDICPQMVGQTGIVREVNEVQGSYKYALDIPGKQAWYDEGQLESIK